MPWSSPLAWPIELRDGAVLRTLEDAGRALAEMSADRQKHEWVLHAARLLMTAAETGREDDIEEATRQVERALKREGLMR